MDMHMLQELNFARLHLVTSLPVNYTANDVGAIVFFNDKFYVWDGAVWQTYADHVSNIAEVAGPLDAAKNLLTVYNTDNNVFNKIKLNNFAKKKETIFVYADERDPGVLDNSYDQDRVDLRTYEYAGDPKLVKKYGLFPYDSTKYFQCRIPLPDEYDGNPITVKYGFMTGDTAPVTDDRVYWEIVGRYYSHGDQFNQPFLDTPIETYEKVSAGNTIFKTADSSNITITNSRAGQGLAYFRINRKNTDVINNYNGDAHLIWVGFEYWRNLYSS